MATTAVVIPIANGRVHSTQSPTVAQAYDTNQTKWTATFSASAEQRLHFSWHVPGNYLSGNLTVKLRWRTTATSGDVVWKAYYIFKQDGGTSAASNTTTGTTTASGSAGVIYETSLTLSTGIGANRLLLFTIGRDAAAGGDTCANTAELLDIIMEYTSDPTITKAYFWVPVNAGAIPSASSSTVTLGGVATSTHFSSTGDELQPYVLTMVDSPSATADFKVSLPANYNGSPTISLWMNPKSTSQSSIVFSAASGAVGSARDPSLTSGGGTHSVTGSASTTNLDLQRSFTTVTPSASDELVLRMKRDNTDASAVPIEVIGFQFEFNVNASYPVTVRMDPGAAVVPASNPASLTQSNDTNASRWVMRHADGSTTSGDYLAAIYSTYTSGGTLRVRWSSSASSGNGRFRVDYGSPATSSSADPALTSGTAFDTATSGANLINEWTFDVSSGLVAGDNLNVRIVREGGHANDTLGASVDILEVVLEHYATL